MHTPLWSPSAARIERSQLRRFIDCVAARRGLQFEDYAALHRWSIDRPDAFWFELAHFCAVSADYADAPVLRNGHLLPGAEWFPGATLNYAENLLRYHDDHPALIGHTERGRRDTVSYRQLQGEVARIANGLRALGVKSGDRIAAFMPNLSETVIAMLAASSIGAVWTSCSPDFGIEGVFDRFSQVQPKILFTADGYHYGGKTHATLTTALALQQRLPSLEQIVVVSLIGAALSAAPRVTPWSEFGNSHAGLAQGKPSFARLPFDHPLFILYSSGTTGVPKCIVHGAGGTLLQHMKEHQLHVDVQRHDRLFYFTTCGWMMWNWLVSALASGATLMLYDGSPVYPDEGVLWRMAETEHVSVFGTSPKYLSTLEKSAYKPREHVELPALRTLLSTGSPLAAESFDFVYREIKQDLHLSSISGGTDIISCFCLGNPLAPVYRGELQCAGLGMAVDVVDEHGASLAPGERGELVCRTPAPSMPIGFWNDADGSKYRAAYFERHANIWHHGDYAMRTEHGGFEILGRSDAVLNPGGIRIGTAEIYRQVERVPEVLESLCIAQRWQGDERIVLFVRLREGLSLDEALSERIRNEIRHHTSPRHVPARILAVADIPRTRSGKLVELAVRDIVHGRPIANTEAIANPEALEHFRDRKELQN
jgi:acetoacetyl-CoA synthetase